MRFCTTSQWKMERKIIPFECLPDRKEKKLFFTYPYTEYLYVFDEAAETIERDCTYCVSSLQYGVCCCHSSGLIDSYCGTGEF